MMSRPDLVLSGNIWSENGFKPGRITVRDGRIAEVDFKPGPSAEADFDFGDAMITPGLIDLQLNGAIGFDFTQNPETVEVVAETLPKWGVTSFLPTFITAPIETYYKALEYLRDRKQGKPGANILGAHLEGPYLNTTFRGAHDSNYIREPSLGEINRLLSYGTMKFLTLAPEEPGALELVRRANEEGVLVAAGHSGATYEEGVAAFGAGVHCATHLFNAMPILNHRAPGLVGAALENPEITTNLIVDGVHLHPTVVRFIYRLKGWERICLVTDAMAGLGMKPGRYELAGQMVIVDHNSARLVERESLAGSILSLNDALRNMIEFTGCPAYEAVNMATLNPARMLGIQDRKGQLQPGFDADIAVFSPEFEPLLTIVGGAVVFSKN
ncbi:MAG: N-acetylglucosamine-6-phosphate deacetylase [Chloroflexi bacterium]|nr:N-acetylglucosamine-6-phosphate deacetylase [Chloroflexota bacterium]